jgi:hypothetical protein
LLRVGVLFGSNNILPRLKLLKGAPECLEHEHSRTRSTPLKTAAHGHLFQLPHAPVRFSQCMRLFFDGSNAELKEFGGRMGWEKLYGVKK